MEDFVRFAISKKLQKYGFSSHAPLPFNTAWTMNAEDFDEYQTEFLRLKQKYSQQIDLYFGLEVDYIHGCSDALSSFFADKKFDYLIGSIHYLDKLDNGKYWSIDGAFEDFDYGLQKLLNGDIVSGTNRFFEITKLMIEKGGFNIVGHFDKIMYHGKNYADFDIKRDWYQKHIIELFSLIKSKGMLLEINTKSVRDYGMTYPHNLFFPLINEMQIPVVINSDCHYPTNIISSFDVTFSELKKAGIQQTYQFNGFNWEAVEI